ncbi:MAG TPA: GAF domain-containing sensor histidine kinase [Chthonomonadales bacterium]|nr:GAF domain-containing sensor histidine kinase [Chthonomonadales bacterium]
MVKDPIPAGPGDRHAAIRERQLRAVHTISRLLSSTLDLDQRLRDILEVSMEAVEAEAGSLYLHRKRDDKLVFQYVVGPKAAELTGRALDASEGVAGSVFRSGVASVTNHPRETAGFRADIGESVGFVTESIVTVPLRYQAGAPVGVMQILNKRSGDFNEDDLEALEIVASVAAAAIENAHLAREAQVAAVAHTIGNVSHDIKNKITPISLSAETLRQLLRDLFADLSRALDGAPREIEEPVRACTAPVQDLYDELLTMITDQVSEVQDYTKVIADALQGIVSEPRLEPNDLEAVLAKQIAALAPVAHKQGVSLVGSFAGAPTFRFDRVLVERSVYNLVLNAVAATPEGGNVTVRVRVVPEGRFPGGNHVAIEVRDTGRGMPAYVMDQILRGEAKSTKPGGTGLGTRIVCTAVAAHSGVLDGESVEGVGTAFRIRLPYVRSEARASSAD